MSKLNRKIVKNHLQAIKDRVDALMGANAGDGMGPTEAAAVINNDFGSAFTPRQIMNLWIDGNPE